MLVILALLLKARLNADIQIVLSKKLCLAVNNIAHLLLRVENKTHNVVSYTAVAAEQVALVDQYQRPTLGVFTRRFIEAFKNKNADANSDGKITHQELLAYLRRKSNSYCQKSSFCKTGVGLTPQLDIKAAMSDDDIRVWAAINDAMPVAS